MANQKRDERRKDRAWRQRLGAAVKRARGNQTQAALAIEIGVDWTTISNIERGETAPDYATIEALADALRVSVDRLTGRNAGGIRVHDSDATLHVDFLVAPKSGATIDFNRANQIRQKAASALSVAFPNQEVAFTQEDKPLTLASGEFNARVAGAVEALLPELLREHLRALSVAQIEQIPDDPSRPPRSPKTKKAPDPTS